MASRNIDHVQSSDNVNHNLVANYKKFMSINSLACFNIFIPFSLLIYSYIFFLIFQLGVFYELWYYGRCRLFIWSLKLLCSFLGDHMTVNKYLWYQPQHIFLVLLLLKSKNTYNMVQITKFEQKVFLEEEKIWCARK